MQMVARTKLITMKKIDKPTTTTFATRAGLIAATVGSAVGLGNIWRFPSMVQANGGAAFLIVYIICIAIMGIPVMLGEFSLGRAGKSDAIGVYRKLSPGKRWWMIGILGILASYVILTFYVVVAGWTVEYFWQSLTGELFNAPKGYEPGSVSMFVYKMNDYISSPVKPVVYTYVMILLNIGILLMGVQKGIERMSNLMMPLLFALLLVFVFVTLQMPGAPEGMEYFLKPDFSQINTKVCIDALGQAFFSLSLGMGTLITYGSYFPKDTPLARTALTVSGLDLLVAILMGLVIFPAVMTFGLQGESFDGASLVFVTLPEIFANMPVSRLWAVMFFLLLMIAALTSCISVAEVTIVFFKDRFKMSRRNAVLLVLLPLFIFSALCSLSNGVLSDIKIFGMTIFETLDLLGTNILLPLGAMLMCIYLGWFAPKGLLRGELSNHGKLHGWYIGTVAFLLKWVCPALILLVFLARFIDLS